MHLPAGSWALYVDDDLTNIYKPDLNLHELVTLGFLQATQRHVHLWGLNTSSAARNLRDNYSEKLGLISGYFYGLVVDPSVGEATTVSDSEGGAAEDVERSLRYYVHGGLLRLCFATARAKTWANDGGLQHHFATHSDRAAAHERVIRKLCAEFPTLLHQAQSSPNGCQFSRETFDVGDVGEEPAGQESEPDTEKGTVTDECAQPVVKPSAPKSPLECRICGKAYARASDLKHHIGTVHAKSPPEFQCPSCGKCFRKQKTMLVHVRMLRCGSKRGKPWPALRSNMASDLSLPAKMVGDV
jgi:hypothetical protein